MSDPGGKRIKLSGLWRHAGPRGDYYTGELGRGRLLVTHNREKQPGDRAPDMVLWIVPPDETP